MRLPNIPQKIKDLPDLSKDIFILVLIFLVGIGAFMLGQHAAFEEKRAGELRIVGEAKESTPQLQESTATGPGMISKNPQPEIISIAKPDGMYVGSRSGTMYHLPWCSGAKRIREENKIWFESREEAANKGYRPASNCKGI